MEVRVFINSYLPCFVFGRPSPKILMLSYIVETEDRRDGNQSPHILIDIELSNKDKMSNWPALQKHNHK